MSRIEVERSIRGSGGIRSGSVIFIGTNNQLIFYGLSVPYYTDGATLILILNQNML